MTGDSFTEGLGYDFDDTFVGRISARLSEDGVETLNGGVSSYYPGIHLRRTRDLLDIEGLQFDHLVVFLDLSDIHDETLCEDVSSAGRESIKCRNPHPLPVRLRGALERRALVLHSLLRAAERLFQAEPLATGVNRRRGLWTVDPGLFLSYGQEGLARATVHMDALADLLRRHHIGLTIAVYPWPDQIARHDTPSKQALAWSRWAKSQKAGFIDYFPSFLGQASPQETIRRYFIPGDVHWNDAGHRLIADGFLEYYARELRKTLLSARNSSKSGKRL